MAVSSNSSLAGDWSLLLASLPADSNALRLRTWRSLKALGCAALRDGAYLLPSMQAAALQRVADEVRQHGGSAWVLGVEPDGAQAHEIAGLFDRSAAYAAWQAQLQPLRDEAGTLGETEARRRLRTLADGLAAVQRTDYLPGAAAEQAQAALACVQREIELHFSRGEPVPQAGEIRPLDRRKYQGKRWATRARPWVDRLACCWLIRRFVDAEARFVWLHDIAKLPRGAIGFDFDGAAFSHVGALVSFEVMLASFGLQGDTRLRRIAAAVHYLDVGGIPVSDAPGLESILSGLRELQPDDDLLVAAASAVFDALYASTGDKT
jgi:hypothetical protein